MADTQATTDQFTAAGASREDSCTHSCRPAVQGLQSLPKRVGALRPHPAIEPMIATRCA
jgi:hypothetical protein